MKGIGTYISRKRYIYVVKADITKMLINTVSIETSDIFDNEYS